MNSILRRKRRLLLGLTLMVFFAGNSRVSAQDKDSLLTAEALKSLSIEELMNIEVTLVSRAPVKLSKVASAIQVITREQIHRSGAANIPEALRLASNLQVAQLNANTWIISARGFNTTFANKLLVMIDGRTIYTPLYGGVVWSMQSVLLEDVDRIEVVSGPGGTLWGANAVNGVINIVTRSSKESQGTYVSVLAGSFINHSVAVRHGGKINDNLSYRVYAKHFDRGSMLLPSGEEESDNWYMSQTGFRMDWTPSGKDDLSFQGNFYQGERQTVEVSPFDGQNVMAQWTRRTSETSNFIAKVYFDRYWYTDVPGTVADQLQTIDFDFQHQFKIGTAHDFVWGVDYRNVNDHFFSRSQFVGILPARKNLDLISAFVHDAIRVSETVELTAGVKVFHNVYSGVEVHPSARISLAVTDQSMVWSAASRAVRAPSRFDVDYYLPAYPVPPESPSVAGGPNFTSETVNAYEAGYRFQPNSRSTFSIAGFYNEYDQLYSVEMLPGTLTFQIQNGSEGESWGGEFRGTYQILDAWRVALGYTYFDKDLRSKPGHVFDPSYLGNDSRNMVNFQSMLNLPHGLELDVTARYLDYLPATLATPQVPEYFTFDARLAYTLKRFELAVVGKNLSKEKHVEFGALAIPRSVYGQLTCRF